MQPVLKCSSMHSRQWGVSKKQMQILPGIFIKHGHSNRSAQKCRKLRGWSNWMFAIKLLVVRLICDRISWSPLTLGFGTHTHTHTPWHCIFQYKSFWLKPRALPLPDPSLPSSAPSPSLPISLSSLTLWATYSRFRPGLLRYGRKYVMLVNTVCTSWPAVGEHDAPVANTGNENRKPWETALGFLHETMH